ncbi:hypothetical protein F5876DRAFT_70769 [Lentinula aff. lateritia]|uniref:Uncharacterized protein n=1 Tax=Lentinula aff. lateritia TaxID=2804960 RepID=A0ACC1THP3_9AGAR|nr:hypothetical protein F5876DRAFT_70769 [Lentinula aff. lateritia]
MTSASGSLSAQVISGRTASCTSFDHAISTDICLSTLLASVHSRDELTSEDKELNNSSADDLPSTFSAQSQPVSPEQEHHLPPDASSSFTSAQPSVEASPNYHLHSVPCPPFPRRSPRETKHVSDRLLKSPSTPSPFDNSRCETKRVSRGLPQTPSAPCSTNKNQCQQKRKRNHAVDIEPLAPSQAPSSLSPPPASSSEKKLEALDRRPFLEDDAEFKQRYNNKRRRIQRQEQAALKGVTRGHKLAFKKYVLPAKSQETAPHSEELPFASGGYLAIDNTFHGAQVRRGSERMKAEGFRLVTSEDGMSIPLTDGENHIMACVFYGGNSKSYRDSAQIMTDAILDTGKRTQWKGISFGKGQPEPMRLSDECQPLMEELLQMPCFRQVAGHQSAALATWLPKSYLEHQRINRELEEKLPHLRRNFDNSVYQSMTVNFGPATWTHIHTDSMNDVRIPCAITSGGKYNYKLGGHLILWDLKYTAGGIRRWLDYGGRTEEAFQAQDPKGFSIAWAKRCEGWKESLQFFGTLEDLKLNAL